MLLLTYFQPPLQFVLQLKVRSENISKEMFINVAKVTLLNKTTVLDLGDYIIYIREVGGGNQRIVKKKKKKGPLLVFV